MSTKQELYNKCLQFIDNRMETVQNTIKDIQKALTTETKSSAGDKHETGRAMLQLEREKAGNQFSEIKKVKEALFRVNIEKPSNIVVLGSIVFTNHANYFVSISAGELKIKDLTFYAISPATPIAKKLLGKQKDDPISFRSSTFVITKIL